MKTNMQEMSRCLITELQKLQTCGLTPEIRIASVNGETTFMVFVFCILR